MIYHGPAEEMVPYFASLGFVCPQYTNPADYLFMSIINDAKRLAIEGENKTTYAKEQQEKLEHLASSWVKSEKREQFVVQALKLPLQGGVKTEDVMEKATFWTQFSLLSSRAFLNAWRNKLMLKED